MKIFRTEGEPINGWVAKNYDRPVTGYQPDNHHVLLWKPSIFCYCEFLNYECIVYEL